MHKPIACWQFALGALLTLGGCSLLPGAEKVQSGVKLALDTSILIASHSTTTKHVCLYCYLATFRLALTTGLPTRHSRKHL